MQQSVFVTAQDGLRLHVREYGRRLSPGVTVVCLPGLARTTADFEALGPALAHDGALQRRVIAIDSRGRGRSGYDRNPANYNLSIELADVVTVLIALGIERAAFIGSSRGGILAMLLGVAQPSVVAGVLLHDIGPVIEPKGLARIKSYVGKLPQPRSFEDGAVIQRRLFSGQFPGFTPEQWLAAAHRTWKMENGEMALTYDSRLAQPLAAIDIERPLPPMWKEFTTLARVPMLVIRGANSDILSAATVAAMAERHPGMAVVEVADQGHVPLLEGAEVLTAVERWLDACETAPAAALRYPASAPAAERTAI